MDMNETKEIILSLPEKIKKAELEVLDKERLVLENKLVVSSAKLNITREVSEELLDGKKKYSNKESRDVEISLRIADKYKGVLESIDIMKESIKVNTVQLKFLKNSFTAYVTVYDGGK